MHSSGATARNKRSCENDSEAEAYVCGTGTTRRNADGCDSRAAIIIYVRNFCKGGPVDRLFGELHPALLPSAK